MKTFVMRVDDLLQIPLQLLAWSPHAAIGHLLVDPIFLKAYVTKTRRSGLAIRAKFGYISSSSFSCLCSFYGLDFAPSITVHRSIVFSILYLTKFFLFTCNNYILKLVIKILKVKWNQKFEVHVLFQYIKIMSYLWYVIRD